jgi:chemotaxis methyl-accepting protein methylase
MRWYGAMLYKLVCRRANRRQFTGTFFFRNRAELEMMRRVVAAWPPNSMLHIAVLGCSVGAEVYSILWTIRSARPDLEVRLSAVDNSAEVLKVAQEAIYSDQVSDLVGAPIFERITPQEFEGMFANDQRGASIQSWLRQGIKWLLADACDGELVGRLGLQDIVVASNFLCHMDTRQAERCLRNVARLVKKGGHLFVSGVDLEVRTKVARALNWQPITELVHEIHEGDPSVRRDWPWAWWGLEPLDARRRDWMMRYAVVFRAEPT